MKYFEKTLFWRLQHKRVSDHTLAAWSIRLSKYREHIENIKNRLPKRLYNCCKKLALHDGVVLDLRFVFVGALAGARQNKSMYFKMTRNTDINVIVQIWTSARTVVLKYIGVKKYQFDYPSGYPLVLTPSDGIDTWAYDEVSLHNTHIIHEVFFHSGATLLVECANVTITKKDTLG